MSALVSRSTEKVISVVSLTEIAIEESLGKLTVPEDFVETLDRTGAVVERFGVNAVAVLRKLPWIHRDPFDRMLVAQAVADGCTFGDRRRPNPPLSGADAVVTLR